MQNNNDQPNTVSVCVGQQRNSADVTDRCACQADLLFDLMDEEGNRALSREECFHFIRLCLRTGAMRDNQVSILYTCSFHCSISSPISCSYETGASANSVWLWLPWARHRGSEYHKKERTWNTLCDESRTNCSKQEIRTTTDPSAQMSSGPP